MITPITPTLTDEDMPALMEMLHVRKYDGSLQYSWVDPQSPLHEYAMMLGSMMMIDPKWRDHPLQDVIAIIDRTLNQLMPTEVADEEQEGTDEQNMPNEDESGLSEAEKFVALKLFGNAASREDKNQIGDGDSTNKSPFNRSSKKIAYRMYAESKKR